MVFFGRNLLVVLLALEALEAINDRFKAMGVGFHLSEVKGPVMDRLKRSHLLHDLSGKVFLSQDSAFAELANDTGEEAFAPVADEARGLI
jgi:SulP family sulfate permease